MSRPPRTQPTALGRALQAFVGTEVAGGVVLFAAAVAGLVWANAGSSGSYDRFWHTTLGIGGGDWRLELDLRHWINDALMSLFFLVVALEIKRELVEGELRDRRAAALPVVGAIGGMVVPAVIFLAVAGPGEPGRGWGIPMATDIAFALGVVALVGRRLPSAVRLFLLTLAIVDDIGAIVVIAAFYSDDIGAAWLLGAAACVVVLCACRRLDHVYPPLFVVLGVLMWLALHESGVHATLAGVALGLLAPTRVEDVLHPWTSFLVVPVFALANAGVEIGGDGAEMLTTRVALGTALGLLVGKPLGILAFSWLACRARVASLPDAARWSQLAGVAILGGIGFTVSIFVTGLAYGESTYASEAKTAILASSVIASLAGAAVLSVATRGGGASDR